MADSQRMGFLDPSGRPLHPHIDRVLVRLVSRFRRHFPDIDDEVMQVEVFEEAGRRITQQEQRGGRIRALVGYAWVTLRRIASAQRQLGRNRLRAASVSMDDDHVSWEIAAHEATPDVLERRILLQQLLAQLSEDEQDILLQKLHGLSAAEIARQQGRSVGAVNTSYCRVKRKLREAVCSHQAGTGQRSGSLPRETHRHAAEGRTQTRQAASATRVRGRRASAV